MPALHNLHVQYRPPPPCVIVWSEPPERKTNKASDSVDVCNVMMYEEQLILLGAFKEQQ